VCLLIIKPPLGSGAESARAVVCCTFIINQKFNTMADEIKKSTFDKANFFDPLPGRINVDEGTYLFQVTKEAECFLVSEINAEKYKGQKAWRVIGSLNNEQGNLVQDFSNGLGCTQADVLESVKPESTFVIEVVKISSGRKIANWMSQQDYEAAKEAKEQREAEVGEKETAPANPLKG